MDQLTSVPWSVDLERFYYILNIYIVCTYGLSNWIYVWRVTLETTPHCVESASLWSQKGVLSSLECRKSPLNYSHIWRKWHHYHHGNLQIFRLWCDEQGAGPSVHYGSYMWFTRSTIFSVSLWGELDMIWTSSRNGIKGIYWPIRALRYDCPEESG